MTSDGDCFVYIVPPGQTEFVTAARFQATTTRDGVSVGEFVYGRRYLERSENWDKTGYVATRVRGHLPWV